ncbi:MAG: RluA family pseudouridine synthase [Lentisphaerae bacterium]|nr:RluA family pseudouridine synthase [Lentisphaerota bacterium]MBT4822821.1 RluA family pseudouridine synthase [Lentisphaerota bacterium]MBT5611448.1 RluA family pseudouridine synthase [Lentisphaerota bacterium]MBT7059677.1 RluA family pseudouridine synthase [Lentisphaerota bacterium]MBT7846905.1 RluA family pseudouridine synthase [Lentisphaerota bacterium]
MLKRIVQTVLRGEDAGTALVDYVTARFTYHNQSAWEERIAQGRLLLNGAPADASGILRGGDVLEYRFEPVAEPPVNVNYRTIHDDGSLMVIDKPPDLPCHPAGRYFAHTLWALLKDAGCEEIHFVNRLDRETSGVMLVAKEKKIAKACRRQFELGSVRKVYDVLVEGVFPESIAADGWLFPDPESQVAKRIRFAPEGTLTDVPAKAKRAFTEFHLLAHISGGMSHLRVLPRTGRLHQIRATLHGLGFPVVGDKLYGVDESFFLRFRAGELSREDRRRLRLERQALHASEVSFDAPSGAGRLTFAAPLPDDMARLVEQPEQECSPSP